MADPMKAQYVCRTTQTTVLPAGDALFSEMATTVTLVSEGGGEFVEVEQHGRTDIGKICIDPGEWGALKAAIDTMIGNCRPEVPRG